MLLEFIPATADTFLRVIRSTGQFASPCLGWLAGAEAWRQVGSNIGSRRVVLGAIMINGRI
ncbi:hypothetical protein NXC14_PC00660 (plasmid) [Rhizobium sp. NXC14]|nr:hypothetical protein NXC14_PC00660 [Rhizobium sp. NXC14]